MVLLALVRIGLKVFATDVLICIPFHCFSTPLARRTHSSTIESLPYLALTPVAFAFASARHSQSPLALRRPFTHTLTRARSLAPTRTHGVVLTSSHARALTRTRAHSRLTSFGARSKSNRPRP